MTVQAHSQARIQAGTPYPTATAVHALLDDDGFLSDAQVWTPQLAEQLAREAGIRALGAKHWEVIHLVRQRFFAIGALPVMRLVCRAAGLDPHKAHDLFSSCRSLWVIAGLPNPGDEATAYMN